MNRRSFGKSVLAQWAIPAAAAQVVQRRNTGLPPLKITNVKVIPTSGGRRYRWTFVKIETSEPGLYGIGSASNHFQTAAVVAAIKSDSAP